MQEYTLTLDNGDKITSRANATPAELVRLFGVGTTINTGTTRDELHEVRKIEFKY